MSGTDYSASKRSRAEAAALLGPASRVAKSDQLAQPSPSTRHAHPGFEGFDLRQPVQSPRPSGMNDDADMLESAKKVGQMRRIAMSHLARQKPLTTGA